MAQFLTTKAIAYNIEELIKKSESNLYIVTPYLKISDTFFERIQDAVTRNISIYLIYGKSELTKREEGLLEKLSINLYFKENLHGKCYANEKQALVTSMNLHLYSEANNREFGIIINKEQDPETFSDCISEITSIINTAECKKKAGFGNHDFFNSQEENSLLDIFDPLVRWRFLLEKTFPKASFVLEENNISASDFPLPNIEFSNRYGIFSLKLDFPYDFLKHVRRNEALRLEEEFSDYRFYWTSDTTISVYTAKNYNQNNPKNDLMYKIEAVKKIVSQFESNGLAKYFNNQKIRN